MIIKLEKDKFVAMTTLNFLQANNVHIVSNYILEEIFSTIILLKCPWITATIFGSIHVYKDVVG